jgi:hypothetical protein
MDCSEDAGQTEALYSECLIKLYESLISGKGLHGILQTAETIFSNPILIADSSFKLIAHVERPDNDNLLWRRITDSGYYPNDYIQLLLRERDIYYSVYSPDSPSILTDPSGPNRYMCKMIVVNGKPVGFSTCLEHDRPFTELDLRLFDVFCKIVGAELRSDDTVRQYHTQRYEYFISELLSGPVRADFIEERMKYLGFRLKSSLFVLVAEFRDAKMRREHLMDYYSVALEQAVSAGHCIIYRNTLVMLISQEQKELLSDSFLQSVMKLLEEADMIGGISNRFQNIEELNIYYKQACQAIKAGRKIRKDRLLFDYGSMCCYHLFDIVRQSEDLLKFCDPKLLDIIRYDSEYNTYYAMTAAVYFTTNMNPALTAKRLDIHRNTIDYRINRLKELFDIRFDDNETTFSFEMSFRILRFLGLPPFNAVG